MYRLNCSAAGVQNCRLNMQHVSSRVFLVHLGANSFPTGPQ